MCIYIDVLIAAINKIPVLGSSSCNSCLVAIMYYLLISTYTVARNVEFARAMHNYKERNRTTRLTRDGNAISCNSSWNALNKSFSTLLTSTCEPSYLCRLRHLQSPWRFDLIGSSTRVIASPPPIFSCPRHPRATLRSAPRAKRSLINFSFYNGLNQTEHEWCPKNTNLISGNLNFCFSNKKRYMKIQAMFWIILQASTPP